MKLYAEFVKVAVLVTQDALLRGMLLMHCLKWDLVLFNFLYFQQDFANLGLKNVLLVTDKKVKYTEIAYSLQLIITFSQLSDSTAQRGIT